KKGNYLNAVAVEAPSFGDHQKELLQDMAILTQATYIVSYKEFLQHVLTVYKGSSLSKIQ
ncbi:MAG: hypothetical protein Q8807_03940, partial ['Waltheria sp.' little leaf phytoplasma]|nr:hypothetical protein ['Waltheria sp.' little leaf phytoplasma]